MKHGECVSDDCLLKRHSGNKRHIHTGESELVTYTEYWCPTGQRWTSCSSPCHDGSDHVETRKAEIFSEKIIFLDGG